ncbi:MAG: phage portal protein [Eubacteriales bacterium]|nr:phage portal protein [Eubacteriales bacterium]
MNPGAMRQGLPEPEALKDVLAQFQRELPRLNRLWRYYQGKHDVLARSRLPGLPNQRLANGFPRYIAQVSAGYLIGEPARYDCPGEEAGAKALRALYQAADADSVDLEAAVAQSVFGWGLTLCYIDEVGQARLCALDPRSAFLVHDDTVAALPLFGVRVLDMGGQRKITLYLKDQLAQYPDPQGLASGSPTRYPHPFGRVPMTEYRNGQDAQGDFEAVLPLIDAYDLMQSDRVNDRMQFSDALLVLTGVMGIAEGITGEPGPGAMDRLRQERTLALPDSEAKAEWLVKNPQERDVDVLRRALAEDIHKFSMTPDFADERFAGNASGIAIKYKLFNLEQRVRMKERWFIRGLRERARVMAGYLEKKGRTALDADKLCIRIPRRLPVNELERAQALSLLNGILPEETLLDNAPILPSETPHNN